MTEAAGLREAASADVLSVSRADAQKYERYEKWYANEDGLFTALGKFTADTKTDGSRISLANSAVKVRSSVENLRNPVHRVVNSTQPRSSRGRWRTHFRSRTTLERAARTP